MRRAWALGCLWTGCRLLCPTLRSAGELTQEEVERLVTIIQNPRQFKVPDWMLNRKKDVKDGKFSQVVSNTLDMKLREDLERLKKIRAHRGLRHYCAPQHTEPRLIAPASSCGDIKTGG